MTELYADVTATREDVAGEAGVADLFGRLTADVREVAQAEVDLLRARTLDKVGRVRTAAAFFAAAGVLALAALIALLVGLILALATVVGPGIATLIVVGATLALAGILGLIGRSALRAGQAR